MSFNVLQLSALESIYLLSYFLAGYSVVVTFVVLCRSWDLERIKIKRLYGPLALLHISLILASECSSGDCIAIFPYTMLLLITALSIHSYLIYKLAQIREIDAELLVHSSATVAVFMAWSNVVQAQQFLWLLLACIVASWLLAFCLIGSNRSIVRQSEK